MRIVLKIAFIFVLNIMAQFKWCKRFSHCSSKVDEHFVQDCLRFVLKIMAQFKWYQWWLSLFFLGLPAGRYSPTLSSPTSPNTPPSALFTYPNYLSLLCFNLTEGSSTPHISATSLLDLPSCHLTPACISASCDHICVEHPSVCLSIPMFLLHAVKKVVVIWY